MQILQFTYSDGGRSVSRRPRQDNDCVVVAFANALRIPYDHAYDMLALSGRECGQGARQSDWRPLLEKWAVKENWRFLPTFSQWMAEPAHLQGTWVINIHRHLFTVIDGVIHDDSVRPAGTQVLGAWRVERRPVPRIEPQFE